MTSNKTPVRLIVIGAGNRGNAYAKYALSHPDELQIVGVAERRDVRREAFARQYGLDASQVWTDWHALLDLPRLADGVIIATQDEQHVEPALAMAKKGYHLLLEKPIAPSEAECVQIVQAVKDAGVMLAVCHVLRYTEFTQALKRILDSGRIGEVVSVEHLEPVGYSHQAHSFVRGNWRNEAQSSPMLLAKSCHDLDWLSYIVDAPCSDITSFGSLTHFKRSEQPAGAADRCLDCPPEVETRCPYSAPRYYLRELEKGNTGWPIEVITDDVSEAGVLEALRVGPYGRCVYACDNDVVDHQVVNMQFAQGQTASFTMTAFTRGRGRDTRIFGTRGEIQTDSRTIHIYDFLTETTETIDTALANDGGIGSGHGGGDGGTIHAFVQALKTGDASYILSGPDATLESHRMVFAAERARHGNAVEQLERL